MSTGPEYSRVVTEHVQDAVHWFSRGQVNLADEALRRARDAVSASSDGTATEG